MTAKVSRYTTGGWIEVADFDSLDIRLDALEATSIANATVVTAGNARMGARAAPYAAQARFGHRDETSGLSGWLSSADGALEANVGLAKSLGIYEQGGAQIGSLAGASSSFNGLSFGSHPVYGSGYRSIWRTSDGSAGSYILLATGNETLFNTPVGGSIRFRRGNSELMAIGTDNKLVNTGVVSATGNTDIGHNSIYFGGYGGGWYMNDGSWIRSTNEKNVWLAGGWYGTDGGITVGRGGGIDGNYKLDINGNGHIWAALEVNGIANSANQIRCTMSTYNNSWSVAQMLAYATYEAGIQCRVAIHSPGVAPQLRVMGVYGNIVMFVDAESSSHVDVQGNAFRSVSTIRVKKDVRPLRERDFLPVHLDPWSDTIDASPDIMSLNLVKYRPKEPERKIVPTDPSGDYATVNPDDESSWTTEPFDGVIGHQSRRERLSLIAEEVQYVVPHAVFHGPEDSVEAIDYNQIMLAMLDHVQRLTEEMQTLRYRVTELERQ